MLKTSIPKYFAGRREALRSAYPRCAFVFAAHPHHIRNPDVPYPYRPDSNLYYLTGYPEPNAFFVLAPSQEGPARSVLFVMDRNVEREIWEGERYGPERVPGIFGVDEAYSVEELDARLPGLIEHADQVFFQLGNQPDLDRRFIGLLDKVRQKKGRSGRGMQPIGDPKEIVGEMRLLKGEEEIELLRKASQVSADAHCEAMRLARPGRFEWEVEAVIEHHSRMNGAGRMGYGSIVAGGEHACCLHYVFNDAELKDGDLLLIDAGAEVGMYTSDITRTFPVGKDFSKEQAEIYDVVLHAQKECVAMVKPGVRYHDIHKKAVELLAEGLVKLGLLESGVDLQGPELKRFYPHTTGHWLGMDVHDTGLYHEDDGSSRKLEPGMVFTIEPGVYCQPGDEKCPEKYRGIGVRIEDDILVTESGHEVLTAGVPKERDEIIKLRQGMDLKI